MRLIMLKVLGPRILVKVKKIEEKSAGGIILTEEFREKETAWQTDGEVVQLGNMAYNRKSADCDGTPWCRVGDIVTFSRYGAVRTKTKDTDSYELWILMDKDVLAVKEA
jgi:co-chaperonin GroES (HSP10)